MFIKYPSIIGYYKDEVKHIFDGNVGVIQEKIDGANLSVWKEDGQLHIASRNNEIYNPEVGQVTGFNGAVEYVLKHEGINKLLDEYPNNRLYFEWLVKHTVKYNDDAYKKAYLIDIVDENGEYLDPVLTNGLCNKYGIDKPHIFHHGEITLEEVKKHSGKSTLGERGEGVVIKVEGFKDSFCNRCHVKYVTDEFKEVMHSSGSANAIREPSEDLITEKYCTEGRVRKIMNKLTIELETTTGEKLDKKHTPRLTGLVYHDVIREECWDIQKEFNVISFKALQKAIFNKSKELFFKILIDSNDNQGNDNGIGEREQERVEQDSKE